MKITKKCVMAIAACVLLILQAFGLRPDVPVVNEIVSAVSSVLVMLGILSDSSGGGSVSGAAFDELHGLDSLDLSEMYQAFDAVWSADAEHPALELVGFDTCLMATVDTAYTFCDLSHYLVASEEVEPANGWDYTGWLGALAEDPSMDGATLGTAICDSFQEGCEIYGTDDEITLSVIDLSRISPLLVAYDNLGREALSYACADPIFFSEFGRSALQSENYGGNTEDQG